MGSGKLSSTIEKAMLNGLAWIGPGAMGALGTIGACEPLPLPLPLPLPGKPVAGMSVGFSAGAGAGGTNPPIGALPIGGLLAAERLGGNDVMLLGGVPLFGVAGGAGGVR